MKTKLFFTSFFVVAISASAKAQTDSVPVTENNKSQFRIGAFYNSALNYYGRTDSLKSSGFFPVTEWWLTKNFYLTATPVFVNNASSSFKYAGTVATAGFQFIDKKWFTNISFIKPFYQTDAQLVQSVLKGQAMMTVSFVNNYLNLTAGGDVKFSDKIDYGVTAGVDHIYRHQFGSNCVFVADPSAYVYAGSQQFSHSYLKKSNFLIFPTVEETLSEKAKAFNILSFEFSMPLILSKGKFQLLVTPAYVFPQNLVTVPDRPDLSESGKKMFYITAGTKITL